MGENYPALTKRKSSILTLLLRLIKMEKNSILISICKQCFNFLNTFHIWQFTLKFSMPQVSGSYIHKNKRWLRKQNCDQRLVDSCAFWKNWIFCFTQLPGHFIKLIGINQYLFVNALYLSSNY